MKKAQISLEVLIIMGIFIIGAVILSVILITKVNTTEKPEDVADIDTFIDDFRGGIDRPEGGGTTTPEPDPPVIITLSSSPNPNNYSVSSLDVSLSSDPSEARIYYTTGAIEPTCSGSGTLYENPITITTGVTTITAIGCLNGDESTLYTFEYTLTPLLSFVSTWDTTNTSTGSSNDTQITLPLVESGTYDFTIDWGDDTSSEISSWDSAHKTHTYDTRGEYILTITGIIQGFSFNNSGDKLKIKEISEFGPLNLGNDGAYFFGAENLTITATDDLNLTNTTNLSRTFQNCSLLTTIPSINDWDVSNVTDMSVMFSSASSFNQRLTGWDVSNVTDMSYMFARASSFNGDIGSWVTSNVNDFSMMFFEASSFNRDIGTWNTSNVENMVRMFYDASSFNQDIGSWNTSNVSDLSYMFYGASSFNQDIGSWNTSSVENFEYLFREATSFNQDIGSWDVSNSSYFDFMFYDARSFNQDLSKWCVIKKATEPTHFDTGATSWTLPDSRPVWGTCP